MHAQRDISGGALAIVRCLALLSVIDNHAKHRRIINDNVILGHSAILLISSDSNGRAVIVTLRVLRLYISHIVYHAGRCKILGADIDKHQCLCLIITLRVVHS